eukprot:Clim_evm66s207 gene=Clim_evmTU66s207
MDLTFGFPELDDIPELLQQFEGPSGNNSVSKDTGYDPEESFFQVDPFSSASRRTSEDNLLNFGEYNDQPMSGSAPRGDGRLKSGTHLSQRKPGLPHGGSRGVRNTAGASVDQVFDVSGEGSFDEPAQPASSHFQNIRRQLQGSSRNRMGQQPQHHGISRRNVNNATAQQSLSQEFETPAGHGAPFGIPPPGSGGGVGRNNASAAAALSGMSPMQALLSPETHLTAAQQQKLMQDFSAFAAESPATEAAVAQGGGDSNLPLQSMFMALMKSHHELLQKIQDKERTEPQEQVASSSATDLKTSSDKLVARTPAAATDSTEKVTQKKDTNTEPETGEEADNEDEGGDDSAPGRARGPNKSPEKPLQAQDETKLTTAADQGPAAGPTTGTTPAAPSGSRPRKRMKINDLEQAVNETKQYLHKLESKEVELREEIDGLRDQLMLRS